MGEETITLDAIYSEEKVEETTEEVVETEAGETEKTEEETVEKTEETEEKESTTDSEKDPWTMTAVLDEREKRQAAVKEATELREKLSALEQPKEDISVFEDEPGFREQLRKESQQNLSNVALNMSEAFAVQAFGAEKVAEAAAWIQTEGIKSPHTLQRFSEASLPFHEAVKMFDEEQARLNPEAFKAALREEILNELKTEQAEKAEKTEEDNSSDIPSLASERSSGEKQPSIDDLQDILKD